MEIDMANEFPKITLTDEQNALRGPAKSKLYRQLYDDCIELMKLHNFSFPSDKSNALGINVSELSRWCGFKSRQTIHDNSYIQSRIQKDIAELGISDHDHHRSKASDTQIDYLNDKPSKSDNDEILRLNEIISNQELEIQRLKSQLLIYKSHIDKAEKTHQKQVENMLLFGGRTFAK